MKTSMISGFGNQTRFTKITIPFLPNNTDVDAKEYLEEILKEALSIVQSQHPLLQAEVVHKGKNNDSALKSEEFYFVVYDKIKEIEIHPLDLSHLNYPFKEEFDDGFTNDGWYVKTHGIMTNLVSNRVRDISEPLFKAFYYIVPKTEPSNSLDVILIFYFHHAIGDGVTMNCLANEIFTEMSNVIKEKHLKLAEKQLRERKYQLSHVGENLVKLPENAPLTEKVKDKLLFVKDLVNMILQQKVLKSKTDKSLLSKEFQSDKAKVPYFDRECNIHQIQLLQKEIHHLKKLAKKHHITLNPLFVSLFVLSQMRCAQLKGKKEGPFHYAGEYSFNFANLLKKHEASKNMSFQAFILNFKHSVDNIKDYEFLLSLDETSNKEHKKKITSTILNIAKKVAHEHHDNAHRTVRAIRYLPSNVIENSFINGLLDNSIYSRGQMSNLLFTNTLVADVKRKYYIDGQNAISLHDMITMGDPRLYASGFLIIANTLPEHEDLESKLTLTLISFLPVMGKEEAANFAKTVKSFIDHLLSLEH
ncbi:hypothetical protein ABK040_002885 [Willaertia magna]